ncbi:uncharacterized protein LOC127246952 isoform X2 [Andrographis paniculata]|uniref:uncharacterized protein LOC127246952 isoform X2 n=1 Tax=Andrographis paniculata TaxID=175694 RepID=UPI0021E876C3|nr:uncharacterized protein LOC127246952 isoform X2 [Andrographis paniculata]
MMSEIEVSKEASVVGVGEQCGMGSSSHQDLRTPDCNGSSAHNQASDLDRSYVFVTGTDELRDEDAVGDVDVVVEENAAVVEDKQLDTISENERPDAVTGEVIKSVDEGMTRSAQPCNGNPSMEYDSTRQHEREHRFQPLVADSVENHTDKSESSVEPEVNLVEHSDVKDSSQGQVAAQEFGDDNGKNEGLAKLEKYDDDDLIKSESTPGTLEYQESQVGALDPAVKSLENGDLKIMSLSFNCSGSATVGYEDPNRKDECDTEISSAELLQANQSFQVVDENVIDCSTEDLVPVAEKEKKVVGEVVEDARQEVPTPASLELDMKVHEFKEEVCNEGAMATMGSDMHEQCHLDTALENDCRGVSEQIAEAETVVSSNMESVCDLTVDGKNEEHFASPAAGGIQQSEEPDKHPDGSVIPLETVHAESRTDDTSLMTECVPTSSAHSLQTEYENSVAAPIETVAQIIGNGVPDPNSWTRSTAAKTISESDSTINGVLTEKEPHEVLTEKESTLQHSEAPGEAEVSSVLSVVADDQPAAIYRTLEPEVHVHTYDAINSGDQTDGESASCRVEIEDSYTVENTVVESVSEMEGVQKTGDQLLVAEIGTSENVILQEEESPVKAEKCDVILEPGSRVCDATCSGEKSIAVCETVKEEVLDSFNNENDCAVPSASAVEDGQNMGNQLDSAAVGRQESAFLQESETAVESEALNMDLETEGNALNSSAASNGERSGTAPGSWAREVLDGVAVVSEGVANTEMDIDVQSYIASGDGHEKVISLAKDANGTSETSDVKLEPELHVVSVTSGTENSDKFNVGDESVANTELEVEDVKENLTLGENEGDRQSSSDNISGAAEPEGSTSNTVSTEEPSIKSKTKPFNFLVRVPRFDDANLREQIRLAKLHVDDKTKIRDAIQAQIQEKRASSQIHGVDYEFAKGEGRSARKLVRSKRIEIDSLQTMINKAKNALSIEDIDSQIQNMEHMIQHETLPLKEEKQLIRDIKQLKQLREQLSSNLGSQDEIKRALEQREELEERLKTLRKELDVLKDQVLKAESAAMDAGRKYDDENKKVRELQAQFRAADDVRQSAYAQLQSLRKELSKKNEHFFKYKDAAAIANNYAFSGNNEALYCLCTENVKIFMEMWNTDVDFRKEYMRCNTRSTIRRLGTLDGRALGPNEQPVILPSYTDERNDNAIPAVKLDADASKIPKPEIKQETKLQTAASSNGKSFPKPSEPKNHKVAKKETPAPVPAPEPAPVPAMDNGHARVFGEKAANEVHEEEPKKSAEEIESIRKAEEARREEAEAQLKEQRRLEALAKANEALERKKRRAEKLQMRTELKLQKEAEQKEKEREKRLRKKERKQAATSDANGNPIETNNHNSETALSSESAPEIISRDSEVKDATAKKAQKKWPWSGKQQSSGGGGKSKSSIPPALRSRNKRKVLQQWMWVGAASLLILFLFWMGNVSLFSNSNNIPRRRTPPIP